VDRIDDPRRMANKQRRNAMNRFMTITTASVLALASIAGAASATGVHGKAHGLNMRGDDSNPAINDPSGPNVGSGNAFHLATYGKNTYNQADRVVRHWKGGRFDVVPVGDLDDTAMKASLLNHAESEPRQVAKLQSAIEHNHRLDSRLQAQNVEIGNIIDAQTALDGGITFYVR
jgi:hypothetical protein